LTDLLYFQQNESFGLTERYLFNLARGVDRSNYDVHMMFPNVAELRQFESLASEAVRLHSMPTELASSSILGIVPRLLLTFRKLKPDIIHFNDPAVAGMLTARAQRHTRRVITHHTPELNRRYGWSGKWLERQAFGGHPFIIFTSENDRRTGIERDGIREENSTVVPYGVDASAFGGQFNRARICSELGVPPSHRIVGNVARLAPQKGHVCLIEAAKTVVSQDSKVSFVVVGDGALRDDLASRVARTDLCGRFVFTGKRTDIPRLLSAFDVFVMPSLFEGLCMAVLEALAACLPVVATPVGGIPSSVVEGKTGRLVPPRDADALADAIMWMLGHAAEAREMGLRGRQLVEKKFTMEAMLAGTEAVYNRLLSRRESKAELA
jgi:glycosyltransferase involved in cell wall biosynthesis